MMFALLALVACTDDTSTPSDSGHDGHAETCGEAGLDYVAGMLALGDEGQVALSLTSAEPGPPEKGDNLLVVTLTSQDDDSVIDDADLVLRPFMREHGHGSSPETFAVTGTGSDGRYETEAVNLFMGGLWDLTFEVTLADDSTDAVTFSFCVEG